MSDFSLIPLCITVVWSGRFLWGSPTPIVGVYPPMTTDSVLTMSYYETNSCSYGVVTFRTSVYTGTATE